MENLLTTKEIRLALLVISNSKKAKSAVYTDNVAHVLLRKFLYGTGNRDMEIPKSVKLYKLACTKAP